MRTDTFFGKDPRKEMDEVFNTIFFPMKSTRRQKLAGKDIFLKKLNLFFFGLS